MHPILIRILTTLAGILVGGAVNMALVMTGNYLIPLPVGLDMSTEEGMKAAVPLLETKHFIFPLIAHAVGTLVGSFTAAKLIPVNPLRRALLVSVVFLIGGIQMIVSVGGPLWFIILDLGIAYLPMGYLGFKLTGRKD